MPRPRFKNTHLAGLGALAIAIAVIATGAVSRRSQAQDLQARAAIQAVPAVKLVAPTALNGSSLELPARLEAWAQAPIHARVGGYLKQWSVDIGTPVRTGQLLGEIETPELDQQLAQARAELATARSNAALAASTAARWQSLLATDAVSRQEADEKAGDLAARQSAVQALQANVDRVQATKQYARLIAPFDGVVTARNTDVGALISAGGSAAGPLFVVADIRRLRVYVQVPQRQVGSVRIGSEAQLLVPEQAGKTYAARVESLSRAIQSGSGAMLVQLAVDNRDGELLPGGFATVRLAAAAATAAGPARLGVPPSALIFGKDGVRVAVVQSDGRALLKPVSIARDLGAMVELDAGLQAGERLIDSPPDGLASGDRVRVVEATPKAAA
jgi:RND family efflux transporter MFP subunit